MDDSKTKQEQPSIQALIAKHSLTCMVLLCHYSALSDAMDKFSKDEVDAPDDVKEALNLLRGVVDCSIDLIKSDTDLISRMNDELKFYHEAETL